MPKPTPNPSLYPALVRNPTPPRRGPARSSSVGPAAVPAALALLLAAGGGLVAGGGCGKREGAADAAAARQPQPVTADVAAARVGPIQRSVEVVGTLFGEEDATLANKVPGRVIAIYKDVGDRAEPGEPLAQLLKNDYLLAVQQRRSALLESLAKLGLDDVPGDGFDVGTLPAVRRSKLQADNAGAKFDRSRQLFEQKPPLVSQQDYEDLRTAFDVAKSNYDVEVATAKGLIGEARTRLADLRVAEQALADTTIRAPRESYSGPNMDPTTRPGPAVIAAMGGTPSGTPAGGGGNGGGDEGPAPAATQPSAATQSSVATLPADDSAGNGSGGGGGGRVGRFVVARRFANVGELFSAITPMFRVVDDDPLKLRAAVPERYFRELAVGQAVTVRIDAYPEPFAGRVTRISPQVDEANRTFPIEVQVPNADHRLPPGAFARGSVATRVEEGAVFVPAAAVVSFAGVDKVFVVNDGKAQEVLVELGDRKGDEVEVRKGLKGGEAVATSGTNRLASGVPVQAKPPGGGGGGGGGTRPATRPTTAAGR